MAKNSRTSALLVIGVAVAGAVLFFALRQEHPRSNDIVIGAILPLTGDAAQYGANCRKGIELAADEVNAAGGVRGQRIRIVCEDDKTSPKDAVSAFRKLVSVNRVHCVIGPLPSSCAMATAPIANENKVVSLSPGASTPKLTAAGKYVFRNWQSDTLEAQVMCEYVSERGWKRIAILYINNDFGKSLSDYFRARFEPQLGTICSIQTFQQSTTDFRSQLTATKASDPEAMYLLSYPKETPLVLNQAKELGLTCHFLGVAAFEDPSLITIAGPNAEGVIFTHAIPPSPDDASYSHFMDAFTARYGESPGLIADTGYDAVLMLVEAMRGIPNDNFSGMEIARGLEALKDFPGASGRMGFDENGDVIKPIGIKTVKEGHFEWLRK